MMEELTGEWVIMKEDEIIERNIDIKIILELSKKYEGEDITISKIPSTSYCFYWLCMKKTKFTFSYNVRPGARKLPKEEKKKLPSYPLLPIRFYQPSNKNNKTPVFEGLLDSGSDGVHIHKAVAEMLNLSQMKKVESEGMGGKYWSYEVEIGFIIGRGGREVDFGKVKAVYPENELNVPILIGRNPVFDEYQVIFEEYKKKFKLIPKEDVI